MNKLVIIIVSASNIFGIIPLMKLYDDKRYFGMAIVFCAIISSILMHITETKHKLNGLCLVKYSKLFLNTDRFFAIMTFIYGLYLFHRNQNKNMLHVIFIIFGGICSGLGEITNNLFLYTTLHVAWHFIAYYSLRLVSF